MARRDDGPALPGMDDVLRPIDARPADVDMTDGKRYTAAVLFRDHPQVVKSICVLRFKRGLPVDWIAEALRVSEHTVSAIENYVLAAPSTDPARAAFFIKSTVNKSRRIANKIAIDELRKRLENNPDELTVAEILSIVAATDDKEAEVSKPKEDVVDVEMIDSFDSALNGLDVCEKKRAEVLDDAEDGVGFADDGDVSDDDCGRPGVPDCSTDNFKGDDGSLQVSDNNEVLQGFDNALCNRLCNSGETGRSSGHADTPVAAAQEEDTGGGGARGCASRGGSD